jgi:hypothetical protein
LNNSDAQDALRVIARIAIREVALRANSAPPVEDVTVIGDMTIDRLRHTVSVDGIIRPTKPREFALLETLARCPGIVFSRVRLLDLAWPDPEGTTCAVMRVASESGAGDAADTHSEGVSSSRPAPSSTGATQMSISTINAEWFVKVFDGA